MNFLKQKRNLIFVAGLLALTACNKKDEDLILAEGQVLDAITANPIPNATIEIRSEEHTFCFLCFGYEWYKTIEFEKQTNADGRFAFGFEAREKIKYALGGRSETHYFHEDSSYVRLEKGKNNRNLRLFLNPYAWLKLEIQNKAPLDSADIHVDSFLGFNGFSLHDFSGDSSIFYKTNYTGGQLFKYGYYKSDIDFISKEDSVRFAPGDTTIFILTY